MRAALGGICLAAVSTACAGRVIDLGDGNAGVRGSFAGTATGGAPSGNAQAIVTCVSPADMSATLGSGYNEATPAECDAPQGIPQPVGSAADVASLLVGFWYDCSQQSFGIETSQLGHGSAVQLTSDGHYVAYGEGAQTFEPLSSLPGDAELGDASAALPAATGTYTVVDGSGTYGPGTYELQLHPADGGLFKGQVVVTTAPLQFRFFPTNAEAQVFTPPMPLSPRKGVCSCVNTTETPEYEDDATRLSSAILGKWMWCGGPGRPMGNIGIEFAAGDTWYALNEDAGGNVTRSMANLQHGTFKIVPTIPGSGSFTPGPEPLSVELNLGSVIAITQLLYFPDPRALFFAVGTSSPNGGPPMNDYSICFPMP